MPVQPSFCKRDNCQRLYSNPQQFLSTSMEEFEYNRFDLFDLTGSRVSFFPALLTSGPSNFHLKRKAAQYV